MISIVVVSHSHALAQAAIDLASQMVPQDGPRIIPAAGLDQTTLGTDAAAIAAAYESADGPDGTLVLLDLGSALLSAEMALDFVDPDVAERVRLCPAPLVEGLVAATVAASAGQSLEAVAAEAVDALRAKQQHLGDAVAPPADSAPPAGSAPPADSAAAAGGAPDGMLSFRTVLRTRHGLHARPSALVVTTLAGLDAEVEFVAPDGQVGDASSITQLQALELAEGDDLLVRASGPDAAAALAAIKDLAAADFGDAERTTPDPESLSYLELEPDVVAYRRAGSTEEETLRLETALAAADGFIEGLAAKMPEAGVTGAVLGAIRAMLHDPTIDKGSRQRIAQGESAVQATQATFDQAIELFEGMQNDYLRERATDLRALERLVVKALMGFELAIPQVPAGRPLLLDELDALTAAQVDPAQVPLVVVRAQGTTGHGIIIAQDRGLPVRVGAGS